MSLYNAIGQQVKVFKNDHFGGERHQLKANVADLENKGYEFELTYSNNIGGLDLSLSGNLSHVKN